MNEQLKNEQTLSWSWQLVVTKLIYYYISTNSFMWHTFCISYSFLAGKWCGFVIVHISPQRIILDAFGHSFVVRLTKTRQMFGNFERKCKLFLLLKMLMCFLVRMFVLELCADMWQQRFIYLQTVLCFSLKYVGVQFFPSIRAKIGRNSNDINVHFWHI